MMKSSGVFPECRVFQHIGRDSTHLAHALGAPFPIPVSRLLAASPSFVATVANHIAHLRLVDNHPAALPTTTDRKTKAQGRRLIERYTRRVEGAFRCCVREELGDVFRQWGKEETSMFNKGVEKALSGVQWVVYLGVNVVSVDGDWACWLRGECEMEGMEGARRGKRVLKDV
ncbi:hypothetical protein DE146DRAFT_647246 [Phaeosphaeria sp. MPI-PUGE-AT-0046c]|nr:hypothetical protein DE146DRAFT_647246 [Phaeosphaeria sp. MPI-PUGE-AT-0046c]